MVVDVRVFIPRVLSGQDFREKSLFSILTFPGPGKVKDINKSSLVREKSVKTLKKCRNLGENRTCEHSFLNVILSRENHVAMRLHSQQVIRKLTNRGRRQQK